MQEFIQLLFGSKEVVAEFQTELSALERFLTNLLPTIGLAIFKIVIAILLFFIGKKVISLVLKLIDKATSHNKLEVTVAKFLKSLARWGLYIILIMMLIDYLGFPTSSLLAALGSAGLTIGLALQGSLSNFAGGVLILLMHPFKVGDFITESYTKYSGTVQKIDLFYTTILTVDNKLVVIPNGKLADSSVQNSSGEPTIRNDVPVGISYSADIEKARQVLLDMMNQCEYIDTTIVPIVVVDSLGDSCVKLILRYYTMPAHYWPAYYYITEHAKLTLDENHIPIPFNQLDVHITKDAPIANSTGMKSK